MTGAELIRELRKSGTGEPKLAVARAVIDPAQGGDPKADAAAVVAALGASPRVGPGTVEKAKGIVAAGRWVPPEEGGAGAAIEDLILAGADPAADPAPGKKPAKAGKAAKAEAAE